MDWFLYDRDHRHKRVKKWNIGVKRFNPFQASIPLPPILAQPYNSITPDVFRGIEMEG